jgi:hypothetical protein
MKPTEWRRKLLNRHGIQHPDGRPLYSYRVSDEEFEELKLLLREMAILGIDNCNRKFLMWDAAITIYAAEWWKREYSGRWGWEEMFSSVGLDFRGVSVGARSQLVEIGLQRWKREVRELEGRRQFLGTIATEGGLPLRQLAAGSGWLSGVLGPVIRKHLSRGHPVRVLVDTYQDSIPRNYRNTEIKQILEDMVHILVELRAQHRLQEKEEPIDWLDLHDPSWRERFPVSIDNDIGYSLLSELVDVVAKTITNDTTDSHFFELNRYLKTPDSSPALVSSIIAPDSIPIASVKVKDKDRLPGRININLLYDDGEVRTWTKAIRTIFKGIDSYKLLNTTPVEIDKDHSLKGITIQGKSFSEEVFELPVLLGERLEEDIPWMFANTNNRCDFVGSASQASEMDEALIYVPEGFECLLQTNYTTLSSKDVFLNGELFELEGEVLCRKGDEVYKFETGSEASLYDFEFHGNLFPSASNPSLTFIGIPQVYKRHKITLARSPIYSGVITKYYTSEETWQPLNSATEGVFEVQIIEDGVIVWRKRIGILNENFKIRIKPDRDTAMSGELHISGSEEHIISVISEGCNSEITKVQADTVVRLTVEKIIPLSVYVSILASSSKREIDITVPFPSSGALLYSPEGKDVGRNVSLYLNNLYGYRLRIFNESRLMGKTGELRFILKDQKMDVSAVREVYVSKSIELEGSITELVLIDWFRVIQELLSVSVDLDSYVQTTLNIDGIEIKQISFYRYENSLKGIWEKGHVGLKQYSLEQLGQENIQKLKAFQINNPENDVIELDVLINEHLEAGIWDFCPQTKASGQWLIYPDGVEPYRPLMWINEEIKDKHLQHEQKLNHDLRIVTEIQDRSLREEAIKGALVHMSNNLSDENWNYLKALIDKTQHLPLSTLDIWRVSISEPRFLATLFVKPGFENVIPRIQEELPIIWELVRVKDWVSVLQLRKNEAINIMEGIDGSISEGDVKDINSIIARKIEAINELSMSMNCLSKILNRTVLNLEEKELDLMSLPLEAMLKGEAQRELQHLLQRNAEYEWPTYLVNQIREISSSLPPQLKGLINPPNKHQYSVILLPVLLAWRVNSSDEYGWLGNAPNIFKIEKIKEFDEDWFNVIFNLSTGWISQHLTELSGVKNHV